MSLHLWTNLWTDMHGIDVWWQIVVVTLCVLASYLGMRPLNRLFPKDHSVDALEAQSFAKGMHPLLLFVLLCIGKLILLRWQPAHLISLLIPIFGSLALLRFGIYLSRRIFVGGANGISTLHLLFEKTFSWGVWIVVIFYYTGLLHDVLTLLDQSTIPLGRKNLSILEIIQALVSVVVTVILALWASTALDNRLMKAETLHSSLRLVLSRTGRSLLVLFAILISLDLVGIDLTMFSIFTGALGVGLGFGFQKIASNYVSGFIVLLDRSLSINDLITVDKYSGKVSKINTRYTVLKGLDGVESVIPNEMLISSPVQNASANIKGVAVNTTLTVAYHTDIESLLPMLATLISGIEGISKKSVPSAQLTNFGKNGFELTMGFWITNPADKGGMTSKVNRAIWRLLQEQNIEVPYPQAEVRIKNSGEGAAE